MQSQTVQQVIDITVAPGAPNTGTLANTGSPVLIYTAIAIVLIAAVVLVFALSRQPRRYALATVRRRTVTSWLRGLFTLMFISLAVIGTSAAHAVPTLMLDTSDSILQVTVPQGGGTATATTTITAGTANATGYTLTADQPTAISGITIALTGGDITSSTPLTTGGTPLSLKATTAATTGDTTQVTLTFTIDGTVTPGTKQLSLNYQATDNAPATIQSFTTTQCNALPIYNGTNPTALTTRVDNRGGVAQTYTIGKLADNHCWMLDNLKLGSVSGTITLTPSDSDVSSNFTLPQLYSGNSNTERDYDNPKAYGPVPGDTGSGATNYGYLYNWPAATAGESRTSHNQSAGNAPHSICPKGWRLPTGGDTGEFAMLNAKMNNPNATNPSTSSGNGYYQNWQPDGPFRGALAGNWWDGFNNQGDGGFLWSSSAYPSDSGSAFYAGFYSSFVGPGDYYFRDLGMGVRCLLN